MDLDCYDGDPMPGMPGSKVGPIPIIRMYGITEQGNSVMCHIHGFAPYFFCTTPPGFSAENVRA